MDNPPPTTPSSDGKQIALGLFIIALGLGLVAYFGWKTYRYFVPAEPTATVALNAFFSPMPAGDRQILVVQGTVQARQSVKDGVVRVSVNLVDGKFRQSFMVVLKENGDFELGGHEALKDLKPDAKLYVEAEAWAHGDFLGSEIVYLSATKPLVSRQYFFRLSWITVSVLVVGFLWAFTGAKTQLKNRLAIICTYLVIFFYLTVPLVSPLLLDQSYPELKQLMKEAPVGLVAGVTAEDASKEGAERQWYLNIGGVVQPAPDVTVNVQRDPDVLGGGLVIPLFVLVLSTIGGAINLTRKVPEYQEAAMGPDKLSQIMADSLSSVRRLVKRAQDDKPVGNIPVNPDGEAGQSLPWRRELVKQYMYLISAPFLAIATYYLLMWLDLTQKPIVVLVSFSVGLMSDQIVEKIIGTVGGFLGGNKGQPTPSPAPPPPGPPPVSTQ